MAGGSIELAGLSKHFGDSAAVDNIDLSVASGEFFSLLGPSGCGKTTTLRLIAGFEQPTSGRILLDGADVSAVPPHRRGVNTVSSASPATVKIGDSELSSSHGCPAAVGETAHAVIRPERVKVEPHGSAGPNRVPALVERLVFLGPATQVMLRLATGASLQALLQNDGERVDLAQAPPCTPTSPPTRCACWPAPPSR